MTLRGKFAKIALAGTIAGAVALPATGALAETSRTERALIGAMLGGAAGAALSNGDGEAVAVGALAGAAVGAATGKDRRYHRSYRSGRYYSGYNTPYRTYDRGYYGAAPRGYYDTRGSYYGGGYYGGRGYYDSPRYGYRY